MEPKGTITTLLDLTDRDAQENYLFPLATNTSWFSRDRSRKTVSFIPNVQTTLFRGPAEFGQRFCFDISSLRIGDLLFGAALQIKLGHWLDATTLKDLEGGRITYTNPQRDAWEYANSLGSACIASAELEIDGKTMETLDGDFIHTFATLFADYNTQVGVMYDHLGAVPIQTLRTLGPRNFPTEDGYIHCLLPFFFGRVKLQEALPLIAIKEGSARIFVTLRPFSECVRRLSGQRATCDEVPLSSPMEFTMTATGATVQKTAAATIPLLESVALVTQGALLDGDYRQYMLRKPFEMIHRELQTFTFNEPTKYLISKNTSVDTVTIQLPLEANHPVEEIIWIIRRRAAALNNEWTNYTSRVESEWPATQPAEVFFTQPMLQSAKLQVNGMTILEADEQYFRQHIAKKHKGGYAAYKNYIYGISFAEEPGAHQPTGSINASRANSVRLTMDIKNPGGNFAQDWEIKVFCLEINWMRFENGLANAIFED
jgi:Large eukaryotic DNA virus major capsid protein/Major capsid protein N-terminus